MGLKPLLSHLRVIPAEAKFNWIEFEQPKAGPKDRIHGCIL